jgi:EAL domain-containing protein (putative c-di-GMP-specific phosphodiesterase class I)
MKTDNIHSPAPKLLVIDDDEGITDFIKNVTEEMHFFVNCVNDHESIGRTFQTFQPDVIFLDLCLPGYDGVEVLHYFADMGCKAKIFLISGIDKTILRSASEVGKQCNLNIVGTLSKPFLIEDIQMALENEVAPLSRFTTQGFQTLFGVGEFVLSYRPRMAIKSLAGSAISSVEVHADWVGRQTNAFSWQDLMSRIRAANLLKTYSCALIEKALETHGSWSKHGLDIGMIINVEDEMLIDHTFPSFLSSKADKWDITPAQITIGVSERVALSDSPIVLDLLTRLRIKGFGISIKTSGADVSDLNKLLHLPFTELRLYSETIKKLSRDVEVEFNVSTLISLCNKRGLLTCADGIETEKCFNFVSHCGCALGQGSYFGELLKVSEVEDFAMGNKKERAAGGS